MRTFDQVWLYRGSAWTDYTSTAFTGMALTLQASDILYFAATDWLAGFLFMNPTGDDVTDYVVEVWDGDQWVRLMPERSFQSQSAAYTWDTAWSFQSTGTLFWGKSPVSPLDRKSSNSWPETGTAPAAVTRFWYRITFPTGGTILDTVWPLMYNTYTTPTEIAEFLGLEDFDEISQPNLDYIRKSIRDAEDWLDNYTRKSWRIRSTVAEGLDFNPYGMRPRNQPLLMVTRLGLWNGSTFDILDYGRGEDWWVDTGKGMVFLTLPSFRMRYYSWMLSRYIRQPSSIIIDYLWGADFDNHEDAENVAWIIKRLVGADLIQTNDETGIFRSGLDVLTKKEKAEGWQVKAEERADSLRAIYATGLGTGQW